MFQHHKNRLLPSTGAYSAAFIWYQVVVQTGDYADALEPVGITTRCQLSSTRLVQGQRYQLLLQPVPMQLVPLAWTDGPFSSSDSYSQTLADEWRCGGIAGSLR